MIKLPPNSAPKPVWPAKVYLAFDHKTLNPVIRAEGMPDIPVGNAGFVSVEKVANELPRMHVEAFLDPKE